MATDTKGLIFGAESVKQCLCMVHSTAWYIVLHGTPREDSSNPKPFMLCRVSTVIKLESNDIVHTRPKVEIKKLHRIYCHFLSSTADW